MTTKTNNLPEPPARVSVDATIWDFQITKDYLEVTVFVHMLSMKKRYKFPTLSLQRVGVKPAWYASDEEGWNINEAILSSDLESLVLAHPVIQHVANQYGISCAD